MSTLRILAAVVALSVVAPAEASEPWSVSAADSELLSAVRSGWAQQCLDGAGSQATCTSAAALTRARELWETWVEAPTAESPLPAIAELETMARASASAAAESCADGRGDWTERMESILAVQSAARRVAAVRLAWNAASEGMVEMPDAYAEPLDELTSVFGLGAYCADEALLPTGRWGRVNIQVGESALRFRQNPLERLLMCSNFLSIVTLEVAQTSPALILPPLQRAGLLAEPYASMSVDEWDALQTDPVWTQIVDGIPADRIWWQMVDHADEQIQIWTRTLSSGLINGPAALLYGARTLDEDTAAIVASAVVAPVDLEPFLYGPDIWNTAGQPTQLDVIRIIVDQYYMMVGNTLDPAPDEDGIQVLLRDQFFNTRFVDVITNNRHDITYVAEQMRVVEGQISRAAEELEASLACVVLD